MRALLVAAIALTLPAAASAGRAVSDGCTAETSSCGLLQLRNGGVMPYYRTAALTGAQPLIRRAIVVVHGKSRNADDALDSVVDAATTAQRNETIVLAPFFQPRKPDRPFQLYWDEEWKQGDRSKTDAPQIPRRSSFEILDTFLLLLANRTTFPNLKEIVVAGHSAGGQIVQRYAALSRLEPTLPVRVRYVVSNPSSYMYLNARRAFGDVFLIPPPMLRQACPVWNWYRFGLERRPAYAAISSEAQVRTQFPARLVTYLLGGDDTGKQDLDQSCGANLQGRHRLARGQTFFRFMNTFFPGHRHRLVIAPRQPHGADAMYTSAEGAAVLYAPLP